MSEQRILIYRLGSLGDTVAALPTLRLVASAFANWERWILTNVRVSSNAAPLTQVLKGSGIADGYLEYPLGLRDVRGILSLRRRIKELSPEFLVYLPPPRAWSVVKRDLAFFRWCGIRRVIGVPDRVDLRTRAEVSKGLFEYEGRRLARCVKTLGDVDLNDKEAFALNLSQTERASASASLESLQRERGVVAASIGAKTDVQDWGDENWKVLLGRLGGLLDGWGLAMLGAPGESRRTDALISHWPGKAINLCGKLSVRESAAALERVTVFIGHDSGPMHLAAAVGTPCVAIFSSHNPPGVWFPPGDKHRLIYHSIVCQGCGLATCELYDKQCIRSIKVDEVIAAVKSVIAGEDTWERVEER